MGDIELLPREQALHAYKVQQDLRVETVDLVYRTHNLPLPPGQYGENEKQLRLMILEA